MKYESIEHKSHLLQLPYFRLELLLQHLCSVAIKGNWAPAVMGSQVRLSGKAQGVREGWWLESRYTELKLFPCSFQPFPT